MVPWFCGSRQGFGRPPAAIAKPRRGGVGVGLLRPGVGTAEGAEGLTVLLGRRRIHQQNHRVPRAPQELRTHDRLFSNLRRSTCAGSSTARQTPHQRPAHTTVERAFPVVVARIEHEITLKCFHRPDMDRIDLQPRNSNPQHEPIVINETTADWEIVGVVVGAMIGARPTTGC